MRVESGEGDNNAGGVVRDGERGCRDAGDHGVQMISKKYKVISTALLGNEISRTTKQKARM